MIALVPHCGFLSETSRMLAIGRALRSRGAAVCFATHGGPYTRLLDDAGEAWTPLDPPMSAERCRAFIDGVSDLGNPQVVLQPADELRASVRAEAEFLRAVGATAVVTGFTLSLYLSSRVVGIPLVTSHGGSFVPPVFDRGLAPAPTQAPAPMFDWLPSFALRWMANQGPPRMTRPVAFLNRIAAELGVAPVPSLAALMVGDLTLVTDVPDVLGIPHDALEAWRPRPRSYRPETRLVWTGPLHAQLDAPIPPAVAPFLDGARPTAYVALTSSTPAFIRRVVTAVRAAGVRVIVAATVHALDDLAGPDVVIADILPSHLIMPRVQVAVFMGGQGSVQTAMCSATPFLGFPLHPEQELNVALGIRHGMALGCGPRRVTDAQITAAVRRLVTEPAFADAARRVQARYAGWDGPGRAAEAILAAIPTARGEAQRIG